VAMSPYVARAIVQMLVMRRADYTFRFDFPNRSSFP